jgi:uncharacterized UPF0146 family protein
MQKIFKLNENDKLVVDINTNKKVNIQLGGEEINFFLGNPAFNHAEMVYMLNFLQHELSDSMAHKIYNDISVLLGYLSKKEVQEPVQVAAPVKSDLFGESLTRDTPKRQYSKRNYKLKKFYIQIFDKNGNCVFNRTSKSFRTQKEARQFCLDNIQSLSYGRGMRNRIEIKKV